VNSHVPQRIAGRVDHCSLARTTGLPGRRRSILVRLTPKCARWRLPMIDQSAPAAGEAQGGRMTIAFVPLAYWADFMTMSCRSALLLALAGA